MTAWVNDDWTEAPVIDARDRGFTLGDGLFETILWDGARLRRFPRHVARLHASAAALGLSPPPGGDRLGGVSEELLRRDGLQSAPAAVRITWTAGIGDRGVLRPAVMRPVLVITAGAYAHPATPAALVTSTIRRNETAPSARLKTLSYIDNTMARAEAAAQGGDEAVLLNTRGRVAGGACCNIFIAKGGVVVTPPTTDGALPGTFRAALMDANPHIVERSITAEELARAEAAFITNALHERRTVSQIDGRPLDADHALLKTLPAPAD
ncbi:MAG: branched-chain amino acid aminotransferase [Alphaproteobacteria bacterium]|nr:MAG: branched-chain amino acid aminotransferase [Alphaproteobacteria bacterium]